MNDFFLKLGTSNYYERIETDSTASARQQAQEGDYIDSFLQIGATLDKRNQRFQTTDGFQSKFTQNIPLISESDTLLNGYQLDTYHSYGDITTSLGLYLRAVTGLSDDVRISDFSFEDGYFVCM